MTTVEKIDCFEFLETVKPAWNELLAKSDVDVIFLTLDWLGAWWNAFGEDLKPYVLLVKMDGVLSGIAPLAVFPGRVIRFIGTPNADYSDIIATDKPPVWEAITAYLDEHRRDWDKIELSQIPENSASLRYFQRLSKDGGRKLIIKEIETCSQFVYEGPDADRSNFEYRRSRTIRTSLNVFQRNGGIIYERLKDFPSCEKYLPVLFQLHINRWDMTPTPSKFLEEKHRRFYEELISRLDPENICFILVRSGSTPIGVSFNFEYKNTINFYTMAINQYYKKRSPGQVLLIVQGESLVKDRYTLDFSRGAQEYKYTFANRSSVNYQVTVYARNLAHRKALLVDGLKNLGPVARLLKNEKIAMLKLKISREYGQKGISGIMKRVLGKIGELFNRFVVHYREFYVFKFGDLPKEPIKARLPIEVQKLTANDVDRIATFYGSWENSPKYRTILERFEKKADCFAALYRGNIIAVCWGLYHPDRHGELGLTITPQNDEVLLTDGIATPIYRGMKIVPFVVSQQLSDAYARGFKAIGCIARVNKSSLKAFSIFGLTKARTVRHLKIFGIRVI